MFTCCRKACMSERALISSPSTLFIYHSFLGTVAFSFLSISLRLPPFNTTVFLHHRTPPEGWVTGWHWSSTSPPPPPHPPLSPHPLVIAGPRPITLSSQSSEAFPSALCLKQWLYTSQVRGDGQGESWRVGWVMEWYGNVLGIKDLRKMILQLTSLWWLPETLQSL